MKIETRASPRPFEKIWTVRTLPPKLPSLLWFDFLTPPPPPPRLSTVDSCKSSHAHRFKLGRPARSRSNFWDEVQNRKRKREGERENLPLSTQQNKKLTHSQALTLCGQRGEAWKWKLLWGEEGGKRGRKTWRRREIYAFDPNLRRSRQIISSFCNVIN